MRSSPKIILAVALGGLAVRAFMGVHLLDRIPRVPALADEVILNDPALSLSMGKGMVAADIPHTVFHFDRLYAHHPPLFFLVQALSFRIFGLSALSMRLPSSLAALLFFVVFGSALILLVRDGAVRPVSAALAFLFLLFEPASLRYWRLSRPEPLVLLFGCLAVVFAILAARAKGPSRRSAACVAAAGACFGLALSAHGEAVLFLPLLAALLFPALAKRPWRAVLAAASALLPPCVIWVGVYGSNSFEALAEYLRLARAYGAPGLILPTLIVLRGPSSLADSYLATGYVALEAIVCMAAAVCASIWAGRKWVGPARWLLPGAAVVIVLLLEFAIPYGEPRLQTALVPAILILLLALSKVSRPGVLKCAAGAAAFVVAGNLLICMAYFRYADPGAPSRDPGRYDALLSQIPGGKRVAVPAELWFTFASHSREAAVIYPFSIGPIGRNEWTPAVLREYDIVVLPDGSTLYGDIAGSLASLPCAERRVDTAGGLFDVFDMRL
jgi:hypothetical protein